jgi:hypothetical protein
VIEELLLAGLDRAKSEFEAGERRFPLLTNMELNAASDTSHRLLDGWFPSSFDVDVLEERSRAAYQGERRGSIVSAEDADIMLVRETVRVLVGDIGYYPTSCVFISAALAIAFDDTVHANGYFAGQLLPDNWGNPAGPHAWILATDGTVIDASAGQFGHHTPWVIRIPPDDPMQAWYRRHAGDDHEPGRISVA